MRRISSSVSAEPVGLFGVHRTITAALVSRAARMIPLTSNASSSVSGTEATVPEFTSVISRYSVNVGSGITTCVPGPTTTEKIAWISSFEPFATRIPFWATPWPRSPPR